MAIRARPLTPVRHYQFSHVCTAHTPAPPTAPVPQRSVSRRRLVGRGRRSHWPHRRVVTWQRRWPDAARERAAAARTRPLSCGAIVAATSVEVGRAHHAAHHDPRPGTRARRDGSRRPLQKTPAAHRTVCRSQHADRGAIDAPRWTPRGGMPRQAESARATWPMDAAERVRGLSRGSHRSSSGGECHGRCGRHHVNTGVTTLDTTYHLPHGPHAHPRRKCRLGGCGRMGSQRVVVGGEVLSSEGEVSAQWGRAGRVVCGMWYSVAGCPCGIFRTRSTEQSLFCCARARDFEISISVGSERRDRTEIWVRRIPHTTYHTVRTPTSAQKSPWGLADLASPLRTQGWWMVGGP